MSEMKEKYLGEAKLTSVPKKKLVLSIGDGSVTTNKIADGAVTSDKLSDDVAEDVVQPIVDEAVEELQQQINSLQVGGVALSEDFGDSTTIGITQNTLTIAYEDLYDKISHAQASNIEMLPFYNFSDDTDIVPFETEYAGENETVLTYLEDNNVFAMYVEDDDAYYLVWSATDDIKASTEYNTVDDNGNFTIRTDKLFYYAATAEDLYPTVDTTLSYNSSNPVANSTLYEKYNNLLQWMEEGDVMKELIEFEYMSEDLDSDPLPEITATTPKFAFGDGQIYVWNQSRRAWEMYNDGSKYYYIKYGNKVGMLMNSEVIWKWVFDTSVTVDGTLNETSTNPISNSAVYRALMGAGGLHDILDETQDRVGELEMLIQKTATPIVHFDGVLDTTYTPEMRSYGGIEGSILIDETNEKAVLVVDNGDTTKYYLTWNDGNGTRESSYLYNELGLSNILLWKISGDSLHIYAYSENRLVEVAGSSNSSSNANIKIIGVWGNNYSIYRVWEVGELWYNPDDNLLKECISVSSVGTNPSFRTITPEENVIYIDHNSGKWYVYYYVNAIFRELTNIDLSRSLTEYFQIAQEALAEKQDTVKTIRVWGNDYQVTEAWEAGDLWYNDSTNELKIFTDESIESFDDAAFTSNGLYYSVEKQTLYIYDDTINALTPVYKIPTDSALSSTSENPLQNKVIKNKFDTKLNALKVIRVWGDNYQIISDWEDGNYWYDSTNLQLYVYKNQDFVASQFENGDLLFSTERNIIYRYNSTDNTFLAISDPNALVIVDSTLDSASTNPVQNSVIKESLDSKASAIKIIRVWGAEYQIYTNWEAGEYWYDSDEEDLYICIGNDDFKLSQFKDKDLIYSVERNAAYVYREADSSFLPITDPNIVVDNELSSTSTNPVQNKVIKEAIDNTVHQIYWENNPAFPLLADTTSVYYILRTAYYNFMSSSVGYAFIELLNKGSVYQSYTVSYGALIYILKTNDFTVNIPIALYNDSIVIGTPTVSDYSDSSYATVVRDILYPVMAEYLITISTDDYNTIMSE